MKCQICGQPIRNYQPALHHLTINESQGVDICQDCVDKIIRWQGSIYAKLFPTKAMKKRFGQKSEK